MRFEFATAARIIFGRGTLNDVGPVAREFGRHALVVTGRDSTRAQPLLERLQAAQVAATITPIAHEPTTDDVVRAVARDRKSVV